MPKDDPIMKTRSGYESKGRMQNVSSLDQQKLCVFTKMMVLKKLLRSHMDVSSRFSTSRIVQIPKLLVALIKENALTQ